MRCPTCQTDTMNELRQEGVDLDFCATCKGIWFDQGEMAFYVETSADVPALDDALGAAADTARPCPCCEGVHLKEVRYLPDAPLLIDVCPSCRGVFLEKGELPHLEALARRVEARGKLNRATAVLEKMGYVVLS